MTTSSGWLLSSLSLLWYFSLCINPLTNAYECNMQLWYWHYWKATDSYSGVSLVADEIKTFFHIIRETFTRITASSNDIHSISLSFRKLCFIHLNTHFWHPDLLNKSFQSNIVSEMVAFSHIEQLPQPYTCMITKLQYMQQIHNFSY